MASSIVSHLAKQAGGQRKLQHKSSNVAAINGTTLKKAEKGESAGGLRSLLTQPPKKALKSSGAAAGESVKTSATVIDFTSPAPQKNILIKEHHLNATNNQQCGATACCINETKQDPEMMHTQKTPEERCMKHDTIDNSLGSTPMLASSRDVAMKNSMHAYQWSLRDFDIGGHLGDGAQGTVFLARERRTGYICVLKCITKSHLIRGNQEALLKKEIELQAHLKHPHITCMYTWFDTPSCVFLVMEYCYYGDLFHYLEKHGPFDEATVSRMLFEITWAIRTCHDKRIAHLDLKPENVLVNHKCQCKLADFGLSAHIGSKQKKKGLHINRGTHDYWSPEQCARSVGSDKIFGEFNQKTDIWTLGILSFELRFGRPPFGSTVSSEFATPEKAKVTVMHRIQNALWSDHGCENEYLDLSKMTNEFKDFLEVCLNKNPKLRPTAEELLMHPFIQKHNKDLLQDPTFLSQPRGCQLSDGTGNSSPVGHLGFNDRRGDFLTPGESAIDIN